MGFANWPAAIPPQKTLFCELNHKMRFKRSNTTENRYTATLNEICMTFKNKSIVLNEVICAHELIDRCLGQQSYKVADRQLALVSTVGKHKL